MSSEANRTSSRRSVRDINRRCASKPSAKMLNVSDFKKRCAFKMKIMPKLDVIRMTSTTMIFAPLETNKRERMLRTERILRL